MHGGCVCVRRALICGYLNMENVKYNKIIGKYYRRRSHLLTRDFWVLSRSLILWRLWLIKRIWTFAISPSVLQTKTSVLGTELSTWCYPSLCLLLVFSRKCLQKCKRINEDRILKCKYIHSYSVKNSMSETFQNKWSDNPHWNISALHCTQNPQPRWVTVPGLREGQMTVWHLTTQMGIQIS